MGMNQASFHCPHCEQQRLFQSTPMNHTPHLLAAIFLCGLYLPIWILIAISYKDSWRCAFCGFSDEAKYLQTPRLREQEAITAEQKRMRLSAMPRGSFKDNTEYLLSAYPGPIFITGGILVVILFVTVVSFVISTTTPPKIGTNSTVYTPTAPSPTPPQSRSSSHAMPATPAKPTIDPDYQVGYTKGSNEGKSWAKEIVGGGRPTDQGIQIMANAQASSSGAKNSEAWSAGWQKGFSDGYQGIKPPKITTSKLEPISTSNLHAGMKLYDNEGNEQVTVVGVNSTGDMVMVKYPAKRGGVIETKQISSLANYWFVKLP
jgi:hypothetical protein